jgi:hypothetical protein
MQQETPANHILENAVGLPPPPLSAYLLRNEPPASVSIGDNNFSNLIDFPKGIIPATVSDPFLHALSLTQGRMERKYFFCFLKTGEPHASVTHYYKLAFFLESICTYVI